MKRFLPYNKAGKICFAVVFLLLLVACGEKQVLPKEMLNAQDSYRIVTELALEIPAIDDNFRIMQGGCVTEEFAWFILVGAEGYGADLYKEAYMIKYDRSTMQEIGRSDKLLLGHANDVTYVPETNELYVSQSYSKWVSILDADSLTVKEEKQLKMAHYAIEYVPAKEMFVTALDSCGMIFYDKGLNLDGGAMSQDTTLVTQGICADDLYVYHVLYSTKSNTEELDNMIFVADWEGNLIAKIPVGIEYEPENISLVGDTFYIGFNNGAGGLVYTAKLVKDS